MKTTKRIISMILTVAIAMSLFCGVASAAGSFAEGYTLDDALSKLGVSFKGDPLDWLTINGTVRAQTYTYFPYQNTRTGNVEEHPVYCIDPTLAGVKQGVDKLGLDGNVMTYYRGEKVGNPYYLAIMGSGFPHITLTSLELDSAEQGYYATKMALWMYILGFDETKLGINSKYGASDPAAKKVYDATIKIYKDGMYAGSRGYIEPNMTITADRQRPTPDTLGEYRQHTLTIDANRWIGDTPFVPGDFKLSWADPSAVPAGTRVELSDGTDITSTMKVQADTSGNATIVVKYPITATEFSAQLNVTGLLSGSNLYTAYYSGDEGETSMQRYLVEGDPKTEISRSFNVSLSVHDDPPGDDEPNDMGLRLRKVEAGTNKPLGGGVYEIRDPDGVVINIVSLPDSGEMFLPLGVVGYYSVTEKVPPQYHILPQNPTQSVFVEYGKTATVTFSNSPYGTLMVYKKDFADGRNLEGAVIQIKNITTGVTQTATTDSSGSVTFDKLPCAADGTGYEVRELTAPSGYALDSTAHTVSVRPLSEGVISYTLTNSANPGLRVRKFDAQTGVAIEGITYEVWRDGLLLGEYITDFSGEILLPNVSAGTFTVKEKATIEPYLLDPTPKTIEIKAGDGIKELVFHNLKKPTLIIKKYNMLTAEPLPNTEFSVATKGGSIIWEGLTGADGTITLPDMDVGWVSVTELAPAPGFLPAAGPKDVYLEAGKTVEVKFDNLPCPTLTVVKADSITGDRLSSVRFNVKFSPASSFTGGVVDLGDYMTDANGEILLNNNLQSGWYRVTELAPKSGYSLKGSATQDIFLAGGDNKTLYWENIPLSALIVYKTDLDGKPVQGATFTVRYLGGTSGSGGTIIHTGVTSVNGTIVLTGLSAGTYVVEETKAADGMELSNPSVQTAYISGNDQDVVELHFANPRMGKIVITKLSSTTKLPLAGATFKVTDSSGAVIGANNGIYTTDASGVITIDENLPVGSTVIVTEQKAPDGYILDGTPQTVKIKENTLHSLTFYNAPKSGLQIVKRDSVSKLPLKNVEFTVYKKSGDVLGVYETDADGLIIIPELEPGWIKIVETRGLSGYVLDDTPKDIEIKANEFHKVVFENVPLGGLQILKYDADNRTTPIPNTEFAVSKMNGERLGVYTTDKNGQIYIPMEPGMSGWLSVVETKAAKGYLLDETIHNIEVKDGKTAVLTLYNKKAAGVLLHKVDSITGKGIYGVQFLLSDAGNNPVGMYTSDQDGYVYIGFDEQLPYGKYFLRELRPAANYIGDDEVKTIYLEAGKTTEIKWANTPMLGQIQITKLSGDDNEVNGLPKGSPLAGAVFEIYEYKSGNLVDRIVSGSDGRAVSKPLPLGRYLVKEVSAPKFYSLATDTLDIDIEFNTQIIKREFLNYSANTGVKIRKTGNYEAMPGDTIRYDIKEVRNTSTVPLTDFYWRDVLPTDAVRLERIVTGTYSQSLKYKILATTNKGDTFIIADNLSTTNNNVIDCRAAALGLRNDEYITSFTLMFGTVKAGFAEVEKPQIYVKVLGTLPNGYEFANKVDVGGKYGSEWVIGNSTWVTKIYAQPVKLPRTGY